MLTRTQAEDLFRPYHSAIRHAFVTAIQQYFEVHRSHLAKIHERTKASYINDLIFRNLVDALSSAPNVRTEEIRGQRRLWFGDAACVRLKKLDRNKRPKLNASQMSFDFLYQATVQLTLPDMQPPTNLFIGYTLNTTRTAINGVYIVCINGDVFEWAPIEILENAAVPTPVALIPSVASPSGRVRVRQ